MEFWFLKQKAKEKLNGIYLHAFFGQLICYIPRYLLAMLATLMAMRSGNVIVNLSIALIGEIIFIDAFTVGYLRSLMDANDRPETYEKRYDINLVLSGFTKNYKNTLKTMFLHRLYLFGWGCLMLLPMFTAVGIIAFMAVRPEVAQAINLVMQLIQSPTADMVGNVNEYIANNCAYVMYMLGAASLLSLLLIIPYVRKVYEYEMIPMIIAENPDIPSGEAFAATKGIMHGYRLKYFLLQLSFIGIMILVSIISELIPFTLAMYIAMAAAMPYINMTVIQFYLARTRVNTESKDEQAE